MISKIKAIATLTTAFAIALVTSPVATYAAYNFDFSSSTEEAGALTTELASQGLIIFLAGIGAFLGLAMIMLGAGWVWGRFKKFTGMGKKL